MTTDNVYPYEIHITVEVKDETTEQNFIDACKGIGVKPIVLALPTSREDRVYTDMMTSSVYKTCSMDDLFNEVARIRSELTMQGLNVIRSKIETVPWHPEAPKFWNSPIKADTYFESHMKVRVTSERWEELGLLAQRLGAHHSRRAFRNDNAYQVCMVTLRDKGTWSTLFEARVRDTVRQLSLAGFVVEEPCEIEWAFYDSNLKHDSRWTGE